jgi:hypothetical protein
VAAAKAAAMTGDAAWNHDDPRRLRVNSRYESVTGRSQRNGTEALDVIGFKLRNRPLMKVSMNSTLAATLIATAAGVGAWLFGFDKVIWPAHPQIAAVLITVVVGIVVKQIWAVDVGQKRI